MPTAWRWRSTRRRGVVLHTGDFKIDQTPLDGEHVRLAPLRASSAPTACWRCSPTARTSIARASPARSATSSTRSRRSSPARTGKIVVATFASSIYRMQILVDLAAQFDRKVAFVGRGMIENSRDRAAARLPADPAGRADPRQRRRATTRRRTCVCICTGSQGEPQAALSRIAIDDHRHVKLGPDDVVVFSAREIPGNEKAIGRVMNHIARRGAEVIYEGDQARPRLRPRQRGRAEADAVAGQAALLRADTRGVPAAGAARADRRARSRRSRPKVLLAENGDVIRFDDDGARIAGKVPAGRILIDGTRSGEVGDEVLRDRRHLAGDGLVVPVVAISRQSGTLEETPDVITRGFVLDARTEALLKEIPSLLAATHRGRQRRGADRSRAHQGEDPRGPAAVLPQAFGAAAARAAGRHGDLTWRHPPFRAASASSSASRCSRWRSSG